MIRLLTPGQIPDVQLLLEALARVSAQHATEGALAVGVLAVDYTATGATERESGTWLLTIGEQAWTLVQSIGAHRGEDGEAWCDLALIPGRVDSIDQALARAGTTPIRTTIHL